MGCVARPSLSFGGLAWRARESDSESACSTEACGFCCSTASLQMLGKGLQSSTTCFCFPSASRSGRCSSGYSLTEAYSTALECGSMPRSAQYVLMLSTPSVLAPHLCCPAESGSARSMVEGWMTQSLGYVALVVREYDEAIAFFTGKLGFRLVEDSAAI